MKPKIYFRTDQSLLEHDHLFRQSQVIDSILTYQKDNDSIDEYCYTESNSQYILPLAVKYSPADWTDYELDKKSIFEYLSTEQISDIQNSRCILLIDQSVEGYSTSWLWSWFYNKCRNYRISPRSIIYLSGDQSCHDSHEAWCGSNDIQEKLVVIPSTSLLIYIRRHYDRYKLKTNFNEITEYKKNNKIFLYDSLNLRPRSHRVLNYLHLINADLSEKGNISMPSPMDWWKETTDVQTLLKYGLPKTILDKVNILGDARKALYNHDLETIHYHHYAERILTDLYKNSWVSIVTEASFFDYESTVFISEKTFKPIACMQPFIIVGSKNILKYLRKLGYKTFSPFIDETYDDVDDSDRFTAIVNAIKKIDEIDNKIDWYNSLREIVEHNFNLFMTIGKVRSNEHNIISQHYFDYFKGIENA
jgi:hypothetical protein